MLLTCEKCQTIFRIDDSAIAVTGQHVRCSVCEHVWHVSPPMQQEEIAQHNMLRETLKRLRLPGVILVSIMIISTVLFAFRAPLTASYPQLISVYQLFGIHIQPNLEVLQVVDLKAGYDTKVLRIRGNLENSGNLPAHASPLEVVVTAPDGKLLARENIFPESKFLDAGVKTPFFIQLEIADAADAKVVVSPVASRVAIP